MTKTGFMDGIVEDFGVPVREINGIFFALTLVMLLGVWIKQCPRNDMQ
jgi:hypothetical protein